jgi:GT2 family glycosyltransferase
MQEKTYIVLVAFNGERFIPRFLSSLQEFTSRNDYELVVVDNCSTDSTVSIIEREVPFAHTLLQESNLGFAEGCNVGIRFAQEHAAHSIFLANQDLVFAKGWLAPLRSTLDEHPNVAAVQALILLYPQTDTINSYGNALHFLGFGYTRGYGIAKDQWRASTSQEPIAYCSFAAVLLSPVAIAKVGLLDKDFFMYHEDSDLCWRFWLAGYECWIQADSHVYHQYEFTRSITKFYYIERNRLCILLKNYRLKTLLLIAPIFILWEVGMMLYSATASMASRKTIGSREKLRGYLYFFYPSHWRRLMLSRRAVQSSRVIPDREIVSRFTPVIEFQDIKNPLLSVANTITIVYWKLIKRFI